MRGFLLFDLLMREMFFTPFAILFKVNLTLYEFSIFSAPIVNPFALGTSEFY